MNSKKTLQQNRKHRVRMKLKSRGSLPRLSVFRSNSAMYAQIIDDAKGVTLVAVSQKEAKDAAKKTDIAFALGKLIAQKAKKKKVEKVLFDRGSFTYHGRVKALADGAREGGLQF